MGAKDKKTYEIRIPRQLIHYCIKGQEYWYRLPAEVVGFVKLTEKQINSPHGKKRALYEAAKRIIHREVFWKLYDDHKHYNATFEIFRSREFNLGDKPWFIARLLKKGE